MPSIFSSMLRARLKGEATPGPDHVKRVVAPEIRSRILAELHRELPPGDPLSVAGTQPLDNVVETDANYQMSQNDFAVLATAAVSIALASSPLTVTPVLIVADNG
jgi:hypothetical protein